MKPKTYSVFVVTWTVLCAKTYLPRQMGGPSLGMGPTKLYKHVISPKYNVRCQGNASFASPHAKEESKLKALGYLWTSCERTIFTVMPSFPTIIKLSQNNK